jgi:outer membrane protein, heavy metal efflux system
MRVRKGGWSLLPAAVYILAAWGFGGCHGPGSPPETVQAPGPADQVALAAAYQAPSNQGVAGQNRSVCSFATVDRSSPDVPNIRLVAATAESAPTSAIKKVQADGEVSRVTALPAETAVAPDPGSPNAPNTAPALSLSLDQAISTGLDENPTLVTLRATQPVAEAALRVAKTYPFNPVVQIEVCPVDHELGTGQGATLNYGYLLQTLELAHQQRYREESAVAARNQVSWNIVHAELANAAMTEKLYFTALYQRDLRDLARLTASLNQELLGVVERRFNAGTGPPAEQTTARVAARQSRKQAGLAEANYQTALLTLRRHLNIDVTEPMNLAERLEDFTWLPIEGVEPESPNNPGPIHVPEEIAARFASERPDVLAAQAGTNVAQANADLARAEMVQNIAVGPYYERDDYGTLFVGFRAQMNLPVWNTGRPLANQRAAEATHQATSAQGLRSQAQVEAQTAMERYERARRLVIHERADFARMIPEQLARVRHQFDAGLVDILYVFTIQNNLLQEHRTYLELLNEVAQAAADVTLAAGLPPGRVVSARAGDLPVPPAAPAR